MILTHCALTSSPIIWIYVVACRHCLWPLFDSQIFIQHQCADTCFRTVHVQAMSQRCFKRRLKATTVTSSELANIAISFKCCISFEGVANYCQSLDCYSVNVPSPKNLQVEMLISLKKPKWQQVLLERLPTAWDATWWIFATLQRSPYTPKSPKLPVNQAAHIWPKWKYIETTQTSHVLRPACSSFNLKPNNTFITIYGNFHLKSIRKTT